MLNYKLEGTDIVVTDDKGTVVNTIRYEAPDRPCGVANGVYVVEDNYLGDERRFWSLEAAKYFALSCWMEHKEADRLNAAELDKY